MLHPSHWPSLLRIEPEFIQLESVLRAASQADYRLVPPAAFAWHAWDMLDPQRLGELLLPLLRSQLMRARQSMPAIYAETLAGIEPGDLRSLDDWQRVPVLVKDDDPDHGLCGFRGAANDNPDVLRPNDLPGPAAVFGSGGSQGQFTPTFVTRADREREIQGWRRGHAYHGITAGDRALYTYNTTHKGGQWMQESLWAHGVHVLPRRPDEDAEQVLDNIERYGVNLLFTVQQPQAQFTSQIKSSGLNLHSLVMAALENPRQRGLLLPDDAGRRQLEFLFLGGFAITPDAIELARDYLGDLPVATLLGSSEAIPQACSTNPALTPDGLCHHNNLHLLQSPHYVEVLRQEGERWLPVRKGEQGWLVYTSWARDGTIWIRYAPGDLATLLLEAGECPCGLRSPVISNVHRRSLHEQDELFNYGCAAG